MKILSVLMLALSLSACNSIVGLLRSSSLELDIPPDGDYSAEWHGETFLFSPSAGLADIEIMLKGSVDTTFYASDFPVERFEVPESGRVTVQVTVREGQQAVAHAEVNWELESDIEWRLEIERGPYPLNAMIDRRDAETGHPNPRCAWWWCDEVWRFEIDEDARAYPYEALWLTLWRVEMGECADNCSW